MRMRRVGILLAALVVSVSVVVFASSDRTQVHELRVGTPAWPYMSQYLAFEKQNPYGGQYSSSAPDGATVAEFTTERGLFLVTNDCHVLWLRRRAGGTERLTSMIEGDPGSGASFGLGWSSDSKALFLAGPHSGFDCPWIARSRRLRAIHVLGEPGLWELPPESAAQ